MTATVEAAAIGGPPARKIRRRWIGVAVLVVAAGAVAAVFGVGFGRDPSVVRSVLINRPAPPLRGVTLDGARLDLTSYRGKVVLVNIWASWCAACRAEHPVLAATQRTYAADGLQIIGVDMSDKLTDARRFLAQMGGAAYPSVRDPNAQLAISWGTFAVPETYLLDRHGIIVEKAVGAVTPAWVQAHVLPVLAGR